jgi:hypothetical protein
VLTLHHLREPAPVHRASVAGGWPLTLFAGPSSGGAKLPRGWAAGIRAGLAGQICDQKFSSLPARIPLSCAAVSVLIERSRYFFIPGAKGRRLLALGRLLLKHKPNPASNDVEVFAKLLSEENVKVTKAYVDRHREDNTAIAAEEVELDQTADHLWGITDARLGHWEVFERPAVARLADKQTPEGPDYEGLIEKARAARTVRKKLLPNGIDFTKLPIPEQSEYMNTLWEIIAQDGLADQLGEYIGGDFYDGLKDVQVHYEEMADQRAARTKGTQVNLLTHARNLHRAIQNYSISLLAMVRDQDPANVEMMLVALRPIDALREQMERERARGRGEPEPKEPQPELEELLAEEKAVNEQIGIVEPGTEQTADSNVEPVAP